MGKQKKVSIDVLGAAVRVRFGKRSDYISLTDIAKFKNADHSDDVIRNWLRNRNTVEFLGVWERLNNPGFNPVEFDGIRIEAGLNSFALTPRMWIEMTGAMGIDSQAGRYGGTFAHKDIAFEFAAIPSRGGMRHERANARAGSSIHVIFTDSHLAATPPRS